MSFWELLYVVASWGVLVFSGWLYGRDDARLSATGLDAGLPARAPRGRS